jgi:protein arginine kinase activator
MEICQSCNQSPANVQIVDVSEEWTPERAGAETAREIALCEECAQSQGIPKALLKPPVSAIIKMLKISSLQQKQRLPSCPECGLNLLEFRQKGRLGCPKDYEVFGPHLHELFDRIHGANRHQGRLPENDPGKVAQRRRASELERELEDAIRREAFEQAAKLRDELKSLREG